MTKPGNSHALLDFVSGITSLDAVSRQALAGAACRLELKKSHLLLPHNTVCDHVYFIEKGLTRTFYYKDGKDITDWFSPENSIACSIVSFITRQPDRRGIELLEPSVIWRLAYNDLEALYRQHHDLEHMGRLLVSNGVVQMQKRFDELHFATAAERYNTLMNESPSLIRRAPLGTIASYLGVTQETLSRIRAQV